MKKVIITLSILAGIGGLGFALYAFYKRQITLAMSYCYKFSNISFINTSKDRFTIDLTLKIKNQSDIRLNLPNYMFEVYINNKFITTVASAVPTDLLANAVSLLTVRIDFNPSKVFNFSDVLSLIASALTDKSKFVIRLKGKISANISFIKIKDMPIDMQMTLADILAPADPNAPEKLQCQIV